MDYAVGSVAALISGNVTPNRPKLIKKALTPLKHQPSPNVTPKSEFVDDRSIFLSPSVQKKKAIVKKSPKRIFENPDLDVTNGEDNAILTSPKAEKVKKHLKEELEADAKVSKSQASPKKTKNKLNKSVEPDTPKKNKKNNQIDENEEEIVNYVQTVNESTPTKKKKNYVNIADEERSDKENNKASETSLDFANTGKNKKKRKSNNNEVSQNEESVVNNDNEINPKKKHKKLASEENQHQVAAALEDQEQTKKKKKNKKNKNKAQNNDTANAATENVVDENELINQEEASKKKQKRKNKLQINNTPTTESVVEENESINHEEAPKKKKNKNKEVVNPNAITNQDTDSEHESDNEIDSDTEQTNNEILDTRPVEDSSDEEEVKNKPEKEESKEKREVNSAEEVKRTLFVGNVPFSNKCKKEVKKIFSQYGQIETVRIRTIPVKDARVTPKLAVIKNELHPERSTVNVYVKFKDEASVDKALAENNTVINNHHLRVTRSDTTGAEHDPRRAIFVGNLPFAVEDDTLRGKFEKCGDIESVRIVRDKKTNAGKGFGYVNFVSKDSVELALSMSEEDLTIKNRILRVNRCTMGNQRNTGKPGKFQNRPGNTGKFQNRPGKFQGRPGNNTGRFQDRPGNSGKFQGRPGNNTGRFQDRPGSSGKFQSRPGNNTGKFQGKLGNPGRFQGKPDRFQGRPGQEDKSDGAYRRIMNKRQNEESTGGPPNKRPNITQPTKEKKPRKEFVGMTSEKKKKHKFDKGQKKKKALSEILTKFN